MRTPKKILQASKAIVGRRIRLVREVRTSGGKVYAPGSLWRGEFNIEGITTSGRTQLSKGCIARYVRSVSRDAFELEAQS